MNYTEKLENVTILGAAGKMGSGIVLLVAMEMADLSLKPENKSKLFVLNAVGRSPEKMPGLMKYLNAQVVKQAEKKISQLRKTYADREDLEENGDIINQYVFDVMNVIRPTTYLEPAYDSNIIIEAATEDIDLKIKMLSQINENNKKKPLFLTNTSSIPIGELDKKAKLGGRIIGLHLYNPPAVQKLIEVIKADTTTPELAEFALEISKNMKKIVVPSADFPGFVGNGHFMRDGIYGMNETLKLSKEMSFVEAVYTINKVSQDFMVRPMGIFQLLDYVGIDVCQSIMKVMKPHVKDETIHHPLLDKFMEMGVKGGQNFDGSQKDGFLKYEKGRVAGIYDPEKKQYVAINTISAKCDEKLGALPPSFATWKDFIGNPDKDEALGKYFNDLKKMDTLGAKLSIAYLKRSKEIGLKLVSDKVAYKNEDVNTVLMTGFFHAYGPINDYI
jgi:3-hydroxyacyl-CoA dehydrogenase